MHSCVNRVGSDSWARAAIILTERGVLLVAVIGAMLLACAGVALAQAGSSPPRGTQSADPERYIVVLEDEVDRPRR